jgi:hypothetical protein
MGGRGLAAVIEFTGASSPQKKGKKAMTCQTNGGQVKGGRGGEGKRRSLENKR